MVRGQREKYKMSRGGIRDLKTGVRRECRISRGEAGCTVEVYMSEESEEGVTVLRVGTQQGAAPRVRAVKSFDFGERK